MFAAYIQNGETDNSVPDQNISRSQQIESNFDVRAAPLRYKGKSKSLW